MADFRNITATQSSAVAINAFMRGVYTWMSGGLLLTAVVAFGVINTPALIQTVASNPTILLVLILAELGLVLTISAGISKLSGTMATSLFMLYSGLNGVTLAPILLLYTGASVAGTFVICAGMFGAMSLYGLTTKKDLTSWGSFLFMGLIGIVLAAVVNMFLQSAMIEFVISGVGVLVFTGLTAWDTQQLKTMGETAPADDATAVRRGTILGALRLYLDFINLFLMLLRFFGQMRE
ncbi:Bax inhibitor-1/YccA family protein [Desulfohalobium retbaense]|uniref:Inner membrane protein YbhL n=1 Tax=Desulfohalobium retbaense (strain ATCC 49708 / DSM 5692 / JCM 16813 / HR100) TaxID=485915 RepID=C8X4E4_DESRD|nr:Bax inhibitor-1/YccA family protein [Desulfohalobium retbaense]ACV69418.1 protein of unknown function UPF0005 [Desulfohalobium retbaense DSM 5692]